MVDLFVNRLLFRSGPETLAHLSIPGLPELAAAGRISLTLEQIAVFIILGGAAVVLLRGWGSRPNLPGLLLLPLLATAGLLYFPLQPELVWALNMTLLALSILLVIGLTASRFLKASGKAGPANVPERAFVLTLALTFSLIFYYRAGVLIGSAGLASLPFQLAAYTGAVALSMATCVAAFWHALSAPGLKEPHRFRSLLKTLALPTLIVIPFLYGLTQSYFMTQIFSMVIAMSTDISLSFNMVRLAILSSWFLLSAVMLLVVKGRATRNTLLIQEGLGLVMILSASFLFNYANYVLLSGAGVVLITVPLISRSND